MGAMLRSHGVALATVSSEGMLKDMEMDVAKHDDLLDSWSKRPPHVDRTFVRDGPIDWKEWSKISRRVLFLAKEAYGESDSGESWDLSKLVREEWKGPKYKFWWTLGYWAYGIQRLKKERLPTSPFSEGLWDDVTESVLATSLVNVKKSGGRVSSDDDELQWYVHKDRCLISEQVECLSPHVVVCCSTWALVKNDLWPRAEQVSERVYRTGDMLLLDYWHPANRFPEVISYYAIVALLHQGLYVE